MWEILPLIFKSNFWEILAYFFFFGLSGVLLCIAFTFPRQYYNIFF